MQTKLKTALFSLLLLTASAAMANPNRLIVFGDSYSDNGNVFKLTHDQYPNATRYYQGRFSNGATWVEYYASLLGINPNDPKKFIDFAYGQARVLRPDSITVYGTPDIRYPIPDFADEITAYQAHYATVTKQDLVVVFVSANDFFDLPPTAHIVRFVMNIADVETAQIQRLTALGAKHILVLNSADLTLMPIAPLFASKVVHSKNTIAVHAYLVGAKLLVRLYNARLAYDLRHEPGVVIYNTFKFDHQMFNQHHYTSAMCYQNLQGDYQHIAGPVCSNPSQFFYYDRVHTTATVNALLATAVYRSVRF